jgi:hypothetical protein
LKDDDDDVKKNDSRFEDISIRCAGNGYDDDTNDERG